MLSYLEIALINAVMIVPLALVVEMAGRLFRRPAVTHFLWVLILVKLLTPPLCQIPLIDRDWLRTVSRQVLPPVLFEVDRLELVSPRFPRLGDETSVAFKAKVRPRTLAVPDRRNGYNRSSITSVFGKWIRSENFRQLVITGLLIIWSVGALAWFVIQGMRCVRFRWSLRNGYAAGADLQRFSDQLARRLGLSYSPTVWLMPGVMSPMLWGSGQSLLLIFPELMLDRLDEEATGTLLTHELAHYRRRDHWVRVIALLATGFFWWHPVVWWARREIEAVEEECCDALVVASAAAAPKRYAEAILDVVDFLAERQMRLPPLATGLGQIPFLRQRLTWIMRGPRRQDFGFCGQLLCLGLACTLPLQPTFLSARTPASVIPMAPPPSVAPPLPPREFRSSEPPTTSIASVEVVPTDLSEDLATSQDLLGTASRWSGLEVRSQSPDGRFVVMGNKTTQCLFNFETGREFDLTDFAIKAMAFASHSAEFVSVGTDGFLRLWSAESCEVIRAWRVPGGLTKSVDILPNGALIATGGRDGIVRIWDRSQPQPVQVMAKELAPVNCVRFAPDRPLLAVATGDWMTPQTGRIALFDTHWWTEQISMNWNSPAAAIAFRSDGATLVSGDWQGRVARWSIASGELLGLTEGHKDLIAAAEFSASGSPLVDIHVPDLPDHMAWGEVETGDSPRWFFNGWGTKAAGSQIEPMKPRLP